MQRSIITIIAALTASLPLYAQNDIQAVLQAVEQNNTSIHVSRKTAEAEKAGNHTGLTLTDPEVEFGYLWGSPAGTGNRKDVSAKQSFDMATLTGAKRRMAQRKDELADWQYKADRQNILLEAKQLCMDVIYYNATLKELNVRLKNAEAIAAVQERRLKSGEGNKMEYNNVTLDLASVRGEMQRNQTEREAALAELTRLNGGQAVTLTATEYPAEPVAADFDQWYAETEKRNPALAYLKQQIEVGRQQVAVSKAEGMPTVSVGFMGEYTREHYQGVTLGMSIPLWANKNRVRKAKADVEAAEARQTDARRQYYGSLRTLYQRQAGLRQTIDTYDQALRSTDNTALLKKALDAGSITVVDYLMGARLYYETIDRRMDALRSWHKVIAEMNAMTL